jgi:hypothetical protein
MEKNDLSATGIFVGIRETGFCLFLLLPDDPTFSSASGKSDDNHGNGPDALPNRRLGTRVVRLASNINVEQSCLPEKHIDVARTESVPM